MHLGLGDEGRKLWVELAGDHRQQVEQVRQHSEVCAHAIPGWDRHDGRGGRGIGREPSGRVRVPLRLRFTIVFSMLNVFLCVWQSRGSGPRAFALPRTTDSPGAI